MRRAALSLILVLLVSQLLMAEGPFDSFLTSFFKDKGSAVFMVAAQPNEELVDYFIIGPGNLSGLVVEKRATNVVNVFTFEWDPARGGYQLGDVEGGEMSLRRARTILE